MQITDCMKLSISGVNPLLVGGGPTEKCRSLRGGIFEIQPTLDADWHGSSFGRAATAHKLRLQHTNAERQPFLESESLKYCVITQGVSEEQIPAVCVVDWSILLWPVGNHPQFGELIGQNLLGGFIFPSQTYTKAKYFRTNQEHPQSTDINGLY